MNGTVNRVFAVAAVATLTVASMESVDAKVKVTPSVKKAVANVNGSPFGNYSIPANIYISPYTCAPTTDKYDDGAYGTAYTNLFNDGIRRIALDTDGIPTPVCEDTFNTGVYFNNVYGLNNFQSVGFQILGGCPDSCMGPYVTVVWSEGGNTFTSTLDCFDGNVLGTTRDGFSILNFPASFFGIPSGSQIKFIWVSTLPLQCDNNVLPIFTDTYTINGRTVGKSTTANGGQNGSSNGQVSNCLIDQYIDALCGS